MTSTYRRRRVSAYHRARLAAYLIAYDGRVSLKHLRTFLRQHGVDGGSVKRLDGTNRGSKTGGKLWIYMRALVNEDLVRREGDDYVVTDLADLAAWLADEVDDEYDPGQAVFDEDHGPPPQP